MSVRIKTARRSRNRTRRGNNPKLNLTNTKKAAGERHRWLFFIVPSSTGRSLRAGRMFGRAGLPSSGGPQCAPEPHDPPKMQPGFTVTLNDPNAHSRGVPLRAVADRCGHDPAVLLRNYAKRTRKADETAAEKIAALTKVVLGNG